MFGQELRNARLQARLTQEALAFKADLHPTYISMLENDKKSPTLDVIFRLCRALKVQPHVLIRRVEEEMENL